MPKKINTSELTVEKFLNFLDQRNLVLKKDFEKNNYYLCEPFYCSRYTGDLKPAGMGIYSKRYTGNKFPTGNIFGDCGNFLRNLTIDEINKSFDAHFEKYQLEKYEGPISFEFKKNDGFFYFKHNLVMKQRMNNATNLNDWWNLTLLDENKIAQLNFEYKLKNNEFLIALDEFRKYWYYRADFCLADSHYSWIKGFDHE